MVPSRWSWTGWTTTVSNARYFADGTDFWRVLYPNGTTDGPYISPVSARKVGKNMTKLRYEYHGWGATRVLHREYRIYESFQIQKLVAVMKWVKVDHDESDPFAIVGKWEAHLEWEDWSV